MDEEWTPKSGDEVTVVDTAFADFEGVIESVNEETGKIRVRVSFYGRDTPVELNPSQTQEASLKPHY